MYCDIIFFNKDKKKGIFMRIITITLNPAFDIHCFTEQFEPYHENLAKITVRAAGGKGVNISRALTANDIENTALVVLGEENADDFLCCLSKYGMNVEEIFVKGRIRENITLHTNGAPETRISFSGFEADDTLVQKVKKVLEDKIEQDTIVTFTGRIPEGVTLEAVKKMLIDLRNKGVRIVIDSKSFGIKDLIECRPWLIKPNEEEIAQYIDQNVDSLKAAAEAAEKLRASGIDNVMISLGAKGAVLACEDGRFIVEAPSVDAISTIGAGDSAIGGFVAAMQNGLSYPDMLRTAVCYGSAACMKEGTEPPSKKDIKALLKHILVKRV